MDIVGREQEVEILNEIHESNEAHFLAVYGRRRIGKTYLISEFFKDKGLYFEMTGTRKGSTPDQLFQFAYEFARKFNEGQEITTPKNWGQAFVLLHKAMEKIGKEQKIILFFDEVPWIAKPRSKFLNALEHFWNRYLSRMKNVILIICGSAASWIIKNIINNKGGLHGRVTKKIRLLPFTLGDTEKYLRSRQIDLDRKQMIDLYMAIGGVPKYLSYVQRGKSSTQIINEICFHVKGELYDEFNNLYSSLFKNHEHHVNLVKTLAKSFDGLTQDELLERAKLTSGGTSSKILNELIDAGFVVYVPAFNKKKNTGLYRLIDEYSLFYLTWIEESLNISLENVDPQYWLKKYDTPKWYAWSGCAFESVCLKHIQNIKKALEIGGISSIESGWRYNPDNKKDYGAQIDLVIDRTDHCINLCEMKYTNEEFVIEKQYVEKLKNKKSVFKKQTGSKKALFTTMITTYGAKKNSHYLSIIDNQITMDALF